MARSDTHADSPVSLQVMKVAEPPVMDASGSDACLLAVQLRGRTKLAQDGRQAALSPGDCALFDLSRPCRLADRGAEREVIAVRITRARLPLPDRALERLTAVRIPGRDGLGAAISALALHLATVQDDARPDTARLAAAFVDVVIVALGERVDVGAGAAATRRSALLASAQSFIEQRLGDPDLSPAAVAGAHHVSVRYLHKLFEEHGTTVGAWTRTRRLERCRRDLLDQGRRSLKWCHVDLPSAVTGPRKGWRTAARTARPRSEGS